MVLLICPVHRSQSSQLLSLQNHSKEGMEVLVLGISQNTKIVVIKIQKAYGGLVSVDAAEAKNMYICNFSPRVKYVYFLRL